MPHRTIQLQTEPGLWPPTWPMGLTMLRLLLLPVFLWLMMIDAGENRVQPHPHRWWAIAVFAVMAATDKLDGYLARRLNQTSKLGTLLDPLADKLLIACAVILLSFDWVAPVGWKIPMAVVLAVYGKDLVVAGGAFALLSLVGKVEIRPRALGRLSTVLQLALVLATLAAPDLTRFGDSLACGTLMTLWWSVALVALASCIDYVWQGIMQYRRAQPLPRP